ncbi:STAS/SEC14 domain-containing protein [Denitratisoma sp. DHT3]|uniref:STAS/SEC14 domain-containing protein n=1 Tax=Denitratisoma sp. DHT3 TaxID=1981880 RepID=UPI001198C2F1|nr:STAS/SEC14 domain-containing protein [Denitratisoma sp. DHT3]QDX80844.1 STAS/SEC14 domain-containing protein [Denitratisoma sp. DHT3]
MITIDHQDNRVSIAVLGEFSLADFKELEELVEYKIKFGGHVDLLLDFSQMVDFTIDMAWEDIKFSRAHAGDFNRIAVVTDSQWVTWSAWINQAFVKADLRVFDNLAEAQAWLAA